MACSHFIFNRVFSFLDLFVLSFVRSYLYLDLKYQIKYRYTKFFSVRSMLYVVVSKHRPCLVSQVSPLGPNTLTLE